MSKKTANTRAASPASEVKRRKADHYDDPNHDYVRYWDERAYEHAAGLMAIRRLLHGMHFSHAVDVGGGYGRLSAHLTRYADSVTVAEPSQKLLAASERHLQDYPTVQLSMMQAD